jgi:hypothetical protein
MMHGALVMTESERKRPGPGRPKDEGPEPAKLTAYIDKDLHKRYKKAAIDLEVSLSDFVEAAMRDYETRGGLTRRPPKRRELDGALVVPDKPKRGPKK